MAFAIGYNVKQANELMEDVAKAYNNLGIYTRDQWNPVVTTLQAEWVGEDEQDFEKKLAERICNLYSNSYQLVSNCVNTIAGLAQSWYDFQSKNTIGGEQADGKSKINVDIPKIKSDDEIVKPKIRTISNDADRGLRELSSKATIQNAVDTFVGEIRSKTQNLFEEISTNNAFFGDQTSSIKSYIEKVGYAVGEVTVAVKDMYEALETLANSSYATASTDTNQNFSTETTKVETSLNDLGQSRWN